MFALALFLVCLLLLLFIRIPIFVALGLSSITLWLFEFGALEPAVFMQRMFAGLGNFTLMAIPFFMLCGELMNIAGLSKRLAMFAQDIIGWVRGGLGFTVILTSMFIAAILGSASACAALIGMVMIPEMLARGYRHDFSSALVASAGAIGPIIPPSIPLIVYGVIAQVSVIKLFIGGYIPGIMMGVAFMLYTYIHARKYNYPAEKFPTVKSIANSFISALPTLLLPIIIMGGIMSGLFTPTEAGVAGVVYAMLVGLVIYRKELKLSDLPKVFIRAACNTAMVLMVISTATLLSWVLTLEQIPQTVSQIMLSITDSKYVFLIIINLFLVVMGMFLDSVSGITILAPVLLPAALALGVDPLFFGVMMVVNFSIGAITPPVGLNLYVTSSIAKIDIVTLSKSAIPFFFLIFAVLMMMVFFPEIVTYLPELMK